MMYKEKKRTRRGYPAPYPESWYVLHRLYFRFISQKRTQQSNPVHHHCLSPLSLPIPLITVPQLSFFPYSDDPLSEHFIPQVV